MQLRIRHLTTYAYEPRAERCSLRLKLYPSQFDSQQLGSWRVAVNGAVIPPLLTAASGDREAVWQSNAPVERVEIVAEGEIQTSDAAGVVRGLKDSVRPAVFLRTTPLTQADEAIGELANSLLVSGRSAVDTLHALCEAVRDTVDYTPGATDTRTTAAQALKRGAGVCQDHAHIFISAARRLNLPARYVVGYLLALEENLTQTHAWAEAFAPELGWIGFDPANRLCPTERYVRLACGLDAADASPIRGAVSGQGAENLAASVDISEATSQSQQ